MNFSLIYKNYKGKWIVLDKTLKKVLTYDANVDKAFKKAQEMGEKKPILFKVPVKNLPYVGFLNEL